MQNQQFQQTETSQPALSPPLLNEPDTEDTLHTRIEDYLDRACAPLIEVLPYGARMELRQEIGQHLRALVEAYRELGDTHERAFEKAIEKFGSPEMVARQWRPETLRARRRLRPGRWLRSQWQGIGATLMLCSLLGLFALTAQRIPTIATPQIRSQNQTGMTAQAGQQLVFLHRSSGFHDSFLNISCRECHRDGSQSYTYITGQGWRALLGWKSEKPSSAPAGPVR